MLVTLALPLVVLAILLAAFTVKIFDLPLIHISPRLVQKYFIQRYIWPLPKHTEIRWKQAGLSHKVVNRTFRPNILLIIADDLGINDISLGSGVATPQIDSIRKNGMTFTHSYAGQATCAPSRAAMYTGRYPTQFGFEFTPTDLNFARTVCSKRKEDIFHPILHNQILHHFLSAKDLVLPVNETMISQILQDSGYDTYLLGKWDSGNYYPYRPIDRGYNESLSFGLGASLYQREDHPDIVNTQGTPMDDFLRLVLPFQISHNGKQSHEPDCYLTDYLSREAAALIRSRAATLTNTTESSSSVNPFFINLAFNAPHNPFQALRSDYESDEVTMLPTHMQRVYGAMIRALDRGVGTVLQALRDTGQYEDTLVIFTSDNGGAHYVNIPTINSPYRGWKATLFEGGLRVPLFMQWPAITARHDVSVTVSSSKDDDDDDDDSVRSIDDIIVNHIDIFPTLAQLVRDEEREETVVAYDSYMSSDINTSINSQKLNGISLLNVIKASLNCSYGAASSSSTAKVEDNLRALRNRPLYWRSGYYKAVRHGDWKLQISSRPNKVWMYDLATDPTEQINLADEAAANVTTLEQLQELSLVETVSSNKETFFSDNSRYDLDDITVSVQQQQQLRTQLLSLYITLQSIDKEQVPPLWGPLAEYPIPIDKVQSDVQLPEDEVIYWCN